MRDWLHSNIFNALKYNIRKQKSEKYRGWLGESNLMIYLNNSGIITSEFLHPLESSRFTFLLLSFVFRLAAKVRLFSRNSDLKAKRHFIHCKGSVLFDCSVHIQEDDCFFFPKHISLRPSVPLWKESAHETFSKTRFWLLAQKLGTQVFNWFNRWLRGIFLHNNCSKLTCRGCFIWEADAQSCSTLHVLVTWKSKIYHELRHLAVLFYSSWMLKVYTLYLRMF